ncbi:hypothetical protein ACOJBO_45240 [Rhizobium beringeri]
MSISSRAGAESARIASLFSPAAIVKNEAFHHSPTISDEMMYIGNYDTSRGNASTV